MTEPNDLYPASVLPDSITNSDEHREERRRHHYAALAALKPLLRKGDRIRATRGECCANPATYIFDHWNGNWIVSKSGIDTIVPGSITAINGLYFDVRAPIATQSA